MIPANSSQPLFFKTEPFPRPIVSEKDDQKRRVLPQLFFNFQDTIKQKKNKKFYYSSMNNLICKYKSVFHRHSIQKYLFKYLRFLLTNFEYIDKCHFLQNKNNQVTMQFNSLMQQIQPLIKNKLNIFRKSARCLLQQHSYHQMEEQFSRCRNWLKKVKQVVRQVFVQRIVKKYQLGKYKSEISQLYEKQNEEFLNMKIMKSQLQKILQEQIMEKQQKFFQI